MYTIGQLVNKFGLSRSTLLFYDKIGLLKPSARSSSNYRLYSQSDFDRMEKISNFRNAGLSLESISDILKSDGTKIEVILQQRLESINSEISNLREQQMIILSLIGDKSFIKNAKTIDVKQWVKMLEAAGMDDKAQRQWHIEFEKDLPEAHTDFLQSLGLDKKTIMDIKSWK